MTIDPVNRANQVSKIAQSASVQKNEAPPSKDLINISKDAKELAAIENYINTVKNSTDIRIDKVEQAKKNLESHYFKNGNLNSKILDIITQRILDSLG